MSMLHNEDHAGAQLGRTEAETSGKSFLAEAGRAAYKLLKTVGSLKLTITLFTLSVVLVFYGTLAQKNSGIWTIVDQYFWSWYVKIDLQLTVQFFQVFFSLPSSITVPGWIPFPAGKTIGGLMFANLISAHTVQLVNIISVTLKQRKKQSPAKAIFTVLLKRSGLYMLHGGLLLLFVGEFITREYQIEQNMFIAQGGTATYGFETRKQELAFITPDDNGRLRQVVVPSSKLIEAQRDKRIISDDLLPVDVEVIAWHPNSKLFEFPVDGQPERTNTADAGMGLKAVIEPIPESAGTDTDQKADTPSAYVRFLRKDNGGVVGTYLVSTRLEERTQSIQIGDSKFEFDLRPTRFYKDHTLKLEEVTFERYPGTQTPKNFASRMILMEADGTEREVIVSMNNPFSYKGETYFQHQMSDAPQQKHTVLQVVRNPGKYIPYASCILVTVGLLLHFVLSLLTFLGNQGKAVAKATVVSPAKSLGEKVFGLFPGFHSGFNRWTMLIPLITAIVVGLYVLGSAIPRSPDSKYNLSGFGMLPVLKDGRLKPLDTVARLDLRSITTREFYTDDAGNTQPAIRWYLEAASTSPGMPGVATKFKVFRIENDRLWELLALKKREGLRYSIEEIAPKFKEIEAASAISLKIPANQRSPFDIKVLELRRQLGSFVEITAGDDALVIAPYRGTDWRSVAGANSDGARESLRQAELLDLNPDEMNPEQKERLKKLSQELDSEVAKHEPSLPVWKQMIAAYRNGKPTEFNAKLDEFRDLQYGALAPQDRFRIGLEHYLNSVGFYYTCTGLYGIAMILSLAALMLLSVSPATAEGLRRGAFLVLLMTLVLHTVTLFARMYLMDRPLVFVTNLYSSAVFIGWAGVIGSIVIERMFRLNIGNVVGSFIGVGTCIIAHNLAASGGDTLEMMQAVLDTNFWLATHVTTVTLGYSATYMAGLIGLLYLVLGMFTDALKKIPAANGRPAQDIGRKIGQILYGVVCFAVLLSFVGTVLGGIWADYSWGRFWGWDPKENGAVLIVIWNALILHARWSGLVKDRGIAVLALVGSMITTWSWFGTNLLGVGLHTYGFNQDLQMVCLTVWVSHAFCIVGGLMPRRWWVSPA